MTPDVLIVGAGSAGSVLAEQLSRDRRRRVLVVERGPGEPLSAPLAALPIDDPVRAVSLDERGGRPVVRGSGVGGSSSINGAYWLRGRRADYDGWPWPLDRIDPAFAEAERIMRVRPFDDGELGDVARAVQAWAGPASGARWPDTGVVRVRTNSVDGVRWTTGHVLASVSRPNLEVRPQSTAARLLLDGDRVTGIVTERGESITAGEVVLCCGTLGTARLVAPVVGPMPLHEHPERIVRFDATRRLAASALLQTVIHTADGLEIRPYGDDFAAFTDLPPSGVPIGVADMRGTSGSWTAGVTDLGDPDRESTARMADGVETVIEMLASPEFGDIVAPGSVRVDPVIGMSQHAWGTLPAGASVDDDGRLVGTRGLRVVDGSILPGALSSGPHATIVMLAVLLASTF